MRRLAFLGVAFLAVGSAVVLAQLANFPGLLVGGCTDVGVPEAQRQGVGLVGLAGSDLLYTPDGTNECRLPIPAALLPIGLIAVGGGLVLFTRRRPSSAE
ncbi:hypothetical protein DJ71_05550 [Halorubrum sp. E3]|uniref:Uncharacterized protein n=1 Tax=Halorubrum persicum TaxID=1383844 RepID=A0A2G1WL21_9EURY|nr:hypothetical protein [Halorubrum persicum]OYR87268.1 hypothetical protein DJ71_05550 [Halorubrum sp. E3]PHQ39691.1 hypothetical protein DJ69_04840 [Halorubrum persicum]